MYSRVKLVVIHIFTVHMQLLIYAVFQTVFIVVNWFIRSEQGKTKFLVEGEIFFFTCKTVSKLFSCSFNKPYTN